MAVILEESDHDSSADRHGAVPRTVLRREDRILVFLRELVARIEREAEVGRMRDLLDFGEDYAGRRGLALELVGPGMPTAVPREAEVEALLLHAVHPARRNVVPHAVDLIVVGPERLVLGVEVEADGIA